MSIYINNLAKVKLNTDSKTKMYNRGPLVLIFNGTNTPFNWTGGDPYDVTNWNTFFDLPALGTPFQWVTIEYDSLNNYYIVKLFSAENVIINNNLFENDTGLIYIWDKGEYIIEINESAFKNSYLTYANFPKLYKVDNGAFYTNLYLVDFIAPNLITIGGNAFEGNTLLLSPNLPKVQIIRDSAFGGCQSITSLDFPSATYIGDRCFYDCTSTTYINLPVCTDLGSTSGNNRVFDGFNNQTITAYFNVYLKYGGAYDDDINYLLNPLYNNTITLTWI